MLIFMSRGAEKLFFFLPEKRQAKKKDIRIILNFLHCTKT